MKDEKQTTVQINLPDELPDGITPTLHVFDTYGRHIDSAKIPEKGGTRVSIPGELKGTALRYMVAPVDDENPTLKILRRVKGVERIQSYDPKEKVIIDIGPGIVVDWFLCICTVRGKVVKAIPQPTGSPVDYPVCNARVHICEVDKIPNIIWKIPDDFILRVRDDLIGPLPPDPIGPVIRRIPPVVNVPAIKRFQPKVEEMTSKAVPKRANAEETIIYTNLERATGTDQMREALVSLAVLYPWYCWYPYLDIFFKYDVDCTWTTWTDSTGSFEKTFTYSCDDTPDIYIWVEQFIAGSWKTIYARGARCDTHWNYQCGTEITIRVTHPDAIVCTPPPEIDVPEGIDTWVLPMAVGHMEIAGSASHGSDPLGWAQTDGTASYAGPGDAPNVQPVTDAPFGGYLRFKMLHSLNLPKTGMTRYVWSYRLKPPIATSLGGWTKMDETVVRKYQVPGPGGFPLFPAHPLGPDIDGLFAFRPFSPPSGVWPVPGFWEDQWSAKLDTRPMSTGQYQVRVTVHDAAGNVVLPSATTFQFVVTDTRDSSKETYSTRAATAAEIIDDGFVFDLDIDNAHCTAQLHPVQTSLGATADPCGFLRYTNKSTTNVTLSYEASHPRDRAWFTLDLVRGLVDLDQVEVGDGGLVGALSVPVDTNGSLIWTDAFYTGDGNGNFTGSFSAARFLETCDNAAFAADLYTRAKAHTGIRRLHEYDRHSLMAFALAEEEVSP